MTNKVRSYESCQRSKHSHNTCVGHLSSKIVLLPIDRVYIDYVGPRSVKQNSYILTVVDAFTKYTILIPVKNTKSLTTINDLTINVFSCFGFPKILVPDNVPNFKWRQIADMCLAYGIQHIHITPYYPNPTHASTENKHHKVALRIFNHQTQQSWPQNLHWLALVFNTGWHSSTNATPASLFFDRELQSPLDYGGI